jgi:ADP-heptose:LPS heptosyltransferase
MRLVANGPGIGDSMVLSAISYEFLAQRGEQVDVVVAHPELYENNPSVRSAIGWSMDYPRSLPELDDQNVTKGEHNIQYACRKFGLKVPELSAIRPYFYGEEILPEGLLGGWITMHPQPGPWTRNKDWYQSEWSQLSLLFGEKPIFQLGGADDWRIPGTDPRFMGAPLRQVCTVLLRSDLHICPVTGTMHLAAAVGAPTLVIYGGRENPFVTGYSSQKKLSTQGLDCSPCWLVKPCPYGREILGELHKPCMDPLTAALVFDQIKEHFPHALRTSYPH